MKIREILDKPAEIISEFDWFNDFKDTKSFLFATINNPLSKSEYTKAKIALEMLIKAQPRNVLNQGNVNTNNLDKYILNDLLKRGHHIDEISQMTPEEAFDEYCEHQGLKKWGNHLRTVLEKLQNSNKH